MDFDISFQKIRIFRKVINYFVKLKKTRTSIIDDLAF